MFYIFDQLKILQL